MFAVGGPSPRTLVSWAGDQRAGISGQKILCVHQWIYLSRVAALTVVNSIELSKALKSFESVPNDCLGAKDIKSIFCCDFNRLFWGVGTPCTVLKLGLQEPCIMTSMRWLQAHSQPIVQRQKFKSHD